MYVVAAALSTKSHLSSVRVHVLRATMHTLAAPPSKETILVVLAVGHGGSHRHPHVCIDSLMDRLHTSKNHLVDSWVTRMRRGRCSHGDLRVQAEQDSRRERLHGKPSGRASSAPPSSTAPKFGSDRGRFEVRFAFTSTSPWVFLVGGVGDAYGWGMTGEEEREEVGLRRLRFFNNF